MTSPQEIDLKSMPLVEVEKLSLYKYPMKLESSVQALSSSVHRMFLEICKVESLSLGKVSSTDVILYSQNIPVFLAYQIDEGKSLVLTSFNSSKVLDIINKLAKSFNVDENIRRDFQFKMQQAIVNQCAEGDFIRFKNLELHPTSHEDNFIDERESDPGLFVAMEFLFNFELGRLLDASLKSIEGER